jgi:hypothetical protein
MVIGRICNLHPDQGSILGTVLGFWTDFELPDHLARSAGSTAEFRDKEKERPAQLEKGTGPAYVFLTRI